jgi:PAS domain S-box-containing protein
MQSNIAAGVDDINLIERNLEKAQVHFTGLAADLDNLRRHYRQTLNNLPVGVCSLGSDGEILMWNRAMEQIAGIDGSDVLGSLLKTLPQPWSDTLVGFADDHQDDFQKREVMDTAGNSRWFTLHKASTTSVTQIGEDLVILVEDVTDTQHMEQELLHTERLASIGRLAAGVAHEVGNPITGIACLAQNLEYESDLTEIRQTAIDILKQTGRVTRIVESLVNFSHVGSASGDIQLTACNLADCVDEAISLLSLDTNARAVDFRNHCDRETLVLGDSQRLLQVFLNLLANARDASAANTPVTVHEIDAGQDGVSIAVDDEGSGIPVELQSRVFEPFFTSKEPGHGTGLGLALVYSIMEDLGGSISLVSPLDETRGRGTRFKMFLRSASYDTSVTGDPKDPRPAVEGNPV